MDAILGLNIPTLIDSHPDLMVIEMTSVQPPFLLDFASVLFEPPDFESGIYAGWHDRMQFRFGGNTWFVVAVYNALAAMGLYYMDMHRGNLNFTGIPGIDENDFGPDDEATPV